MRKYFIVLKFFKLTIVGVATFFISSTSAQTNFGSELMNEINAIETGVLLNKPGYVSIKTLDSEQMALYVDDLLVRVLSSEYNLVYRMGDLLTDLGHGNLVQKIYNTSETKKFYHKPHGSSVRLEVAGDQRKALCKEWAKNELLRLMKAIDEDDLVKQVNFGIAEALNRFKLVAARDVDISAAKRKTIVNNFDLAIKKYSAFEFQLHEVKYGTGHITDKTRDFVQKLLKIF